MATNKGFKNLYSLLIISGLILIGCCEKLVTGKPFDCKIGTKYRINGGLSFTIDSISDYRCPKDVFCIWSGDVDLYFSFDQVFKHTDTLIYLLTRNRNPFQIKDYSLKILEVNPVPKMNETVTRQDYIIKIIIEKV